MRCIAVLIKNAAVCACKQEHVHNWTKTCVLTCCLHLVCATHIQKWSGRIVVGLFSLSAMFCPTCVDLMCLPHTIKLFPCKCAHWSPLLLWLWLFLLYKCGHWRLLPVLEYPFMSIADPVSLYSHKTCTWFLNGALLGTFFACRLYILC